MDKIWELPAEKVLIQVSRECGRCETKVKVPKLQSIHLANTALPVAHDVFTHIKTAPVRAVVICFVIDVITTLAMWVSRLPILAGLTPLGNV